MTTTYARRTQDGLCVRCGHRARPQRVQCATCAPHLPTTLPSRMLRSLRRVHTPQHYRQIAATLGVPPMQAAGTLHRLVKAGRVRWVSLGVYGLPEEAP